MSQLALAFAINDEVSTLHLLYVKSNIRYLFVLLLPHYPPLVLREVNCIWRCILFPLIGF